MAIIIYIIFLYLYIYYSIWGFYFWIKWS